MKIYNYGNDYTFQRKMESKQDEKPIETKEVKDVEDKVYGRGKENLVQQHGEERGDKALADPEESRPAKKEEETEKEARPEGMRPKNKERKVQ